MRRTLFTSLLTMVLLLAACGGEGADDGTTSVEGGAEPAEATDDQTTDDAEDVADSAAEEPVDDELTDATARVEAAGEAMADLDNMAVSMEQTFGDDTQSMNAEGTIDLANGRTQMTMRTPAGEFTNITTDGETLIHDMFSDGKWVRMAGAEASDIDLATEFGDLGAEWDAYMDASDAVELGEEEIRGARATGYELTMDLGEMWDLAAGADDEFRPAFDDEVVVELWIDDDDRVVRQVSAFQAGDESQLPGSGPMLTTIEYYDFNTAADITLPPDAEIVEWEDALDFGAGGIDLDDLDLEDLDLDDLDLDDLDLDDLDLDDLQGD